MEIACLGWGSLVWDPGELPVKGFWLQDGPFLPIEFARQSRDGRITLVCVARMPLVQCLWAKLSSSELHSAREALRDREGISKKNADQHIGIWAKNQSIKNNEVSNRIEAWAKSINIDAVIWTNLPPKFHGEDDKIPSADEVVTYLSNLAGDARKKAERYVRMAPHQIRTYYRRQIEKHLNWLPVEGA